MSVRKLTVSLLTALAMLSGVAASQAQEHFPAADPFAFDPDFDWFEPVYDMDLADMKPEKRAPNGWFATYDRLNLYGSRPELDEPGISETRIDSGWGWRYEIGYMLPDKDNGWLFNYTHNGVGAFATVRRQRLNRLNANELAGTPDNPGPPFGFGEPASDRNNIQHNTRFYDIDDTENAFTYNSYELNKTWRFEPYHYGGILEPMVGVRWIRIQDINGFENYSSSLDTDTVPYLAFPDAEQLISNAAITKNDMFGGQFGFRYTKYRDRFTYSSVLNVFFGGNWQTSAAYQSQEITGYDGTGLGSDVDFVINRETDPIYTRNEEFYFGFDVRAELGYQLTKQISLRGGFQLIDIAQGVWRGGAGVFVPAGANDQDLQMVGGTFGINLNH